MSLQVKQVSEGLGSLDGVSLRKILPEIKSLLERTQDLCKAEKNVEANTQIGEIVSEMKEVPLLNPRGKLTLVFGRGGFSIKKGEETLIYTNWDEIATILSVPSADTETRDAQTKSGTLVIALKKALADPRKGSTICINATALLKETEECTLSPLLAEVIARSTATPFLAIRSALTALSHQPVIDIVRGAPNAGLAYFSSAITGAPFVKASLGASQGHLAVTSAGLFFHKPPVFLGAARIASLTCGRGGGVSHSSASFIDLIVEIVDDSSDGFDDLMEKKQEESAKKKKPAKPLEFSNISKEELPELQHFITEVLLKARDAVQSTGDDALGNDDEEEDDDDDFDPDADDDDDEENSDESNSETSDNSEDDDYASDDGPSEDEGAPPTKRRRTQVD